MKMENDRRNLRNNGFNKEGWAKVIAARNGTRTIKHPDGWNATTSSPLMIQFQDKTSDHSFLGCGFIAIIAMICIVMYMRTKRSRRNAQGYNEIPRKETEASGLL